MNPWVIGWVASDGHNAGDYWVVSQNIEDVDALLLIRSLYHDIRTSISFNVNNRYGDKPMVNIVRRNKEDCEELKNYGIPVGDKTMTVDFPINESDDFLWLYLRGFFEGDGSVSIERNRYPRFGITASESWCYGCKKWLSKLNISSYVSKDGDKAFCLNVHTIKGVGIILKNLYKQEPQFRMGRKYSVAMKILVLLEYWENLKENKIKNKRIEKRAIDGLSSGLSVDSVSKKIECSKFLVSKIRKSIGITGHRSNIHIESIQKKLKEGFNRESVIKLGYGKKIVNKAFKLLYGDPSFLREKRNEEIRKLILDGYSVSDIVSKLKCGEGKVIKEKRYLHKKGFSVKLNKTKGSEV